MKKKKFTNEYDFEEVELITVKEAARLLGLSPKTVYNCNGGTGRLIRVYQGRSVRLIKEEVLGHRQRVIDRGRKIRNMIYYP